MNPLKISQIIEEHDQAQSFSGSILVDNQEHTYTQSFGYADRSNAIKNNANTRFGIASGCKIFTAVAVCQLVQEGRLTFETLLKDCTDDENPQFDPNITVHQLLTHSSGIPDYFDEDTTDDFEALWQEIPNYQICTPKDFLPLFQDRPMKFKPGERFHYNNAGYILLGLIVEKISGMEFTKYVEQNIFQRCGMEESGYYRLDQLPPNTALGYIDEGSSWRTNIYSLPVQGGPDGGAFTTVRDMQRFWNALFENRLLDPRMTELLLTPKTQESDTLYYGYGVWIRMSNNQIFKHFVMGGDPGVSMHSAVYANGLHIHVIGNTNVNAGKTVRSLEEYIVRNG